MNRRGVTLIDLMVALAILAVVMTAVYYVFAFQNKAVKAASEGRDVNGQGLVILDRLTRDLTGAWLTQDGQSGRYDCKFTALVDSMDFISTASLSPTQYPGPEIAEVGYRLEPDPDNGGKKILWRRQDDSIDEDGREGGHEIKLGTDIVSLEWLFYDASGNEKGTWGPVDKAAALPRAVRITLVLSTVEDQEEAFQTFVYLPLSWPPAAAIQVPEGFGFQ